VLLDLRSLVEAAAANAGSATYSVTQTQGSGTVTHPAIARGNAGVSYRFKPRPRPEVPQWKMPVPEAPTYRIYGTNVVTFGPPRVQGTGSVTRPPIVNGMATVALLCTQAVGTGTVYRRTVTGAAIARTRVTRAGGTGEAYDPLQIEEEDQWLHDVLQVLGVAA